MDELVTEILEYLRERNWDTLRPSDLAKSISIEAAELLEVFQWDHMTIEETLADQRRMDEVRNELADVLIYCLEMAALLGLDAKAIIREKLERVRQKYPVDLVKSWQHTAEYSGEDYEKYKREFRKKKE